MQATSNSRRAIGLAATGHASITTGRRTHDIPELHPRGVDKHRNQLRTGAPVICVKLRATARMGEEPYAQQCRKANQSSLDGWRNPVPCCEVRDEMLFVGVLDAQDEAFVAIHLVFILTK